MIIVRYSQLRQWNENIKVVKQTQHNNNPDTTQIELKNTMEKFKPSSIVLDFTEKIKKNING